MTRPIIVILIISSLLRLTTALYLGDRVEILPGTFDQISYHNLALRVLDGHGFSFGETWWPLTRADEPTAHWSYLYTFYLVVTYNVFGVHPLIGRMIQAIFVGIAHPLIVYLMGRRLFGETAGLVSAGLTALYTYFIYYSATLMTEPFFITAFLASLFMTILIADRSREEHFSGEKGKAIAISFAFGVILGITVLFRQIFLLLIPFLYLWIWLGPKQKRGMSPLFTLLISSTVLILMIAPITIYNYLRFNQFVLLNTNAGYAFYWANHPIYGTQFIPILPEEMGDYQSLIPPELQHLDEASLDRELFIRGFHYVLAEPGRFALLSFSRIPTFFTFWPTSDSSLISNISRVTSFGLLWPFMLFGGLLSILWTKKGAEQFLLSPIFFLLLVAGIYTLIHLFSWTLIRYRLPIDSIMLIFAGLAMVNIVQRFGALFEQSLQLFKPSRPSPVTRRNEPGDNKNLS